MITKLEQVGMLLAGCTGYYIFWFVWRMDDLTKPSMKNKVAMAGLGAVALIGSIVILVAGPF